MIGIFAAMFVLVAMPSCSDNEDDGEKDVPNESNMSLLYGTWEEVKEEAYKNEQLVPNHWSKWAKWAFQKDGTLIHFSKTYEDKGTYEHNNVDNTLRLKYYGENKKATILKLTEDSLVWKTLYPDDEYDYEILYLKRITSEYDDPFEVSIVDKYTGRVKEIVEKYKDIRPFVGWWHNNSSNGYDYVFTSDMKCTAGRDPFTVGEAGTWNYNADKQILGTTMDRTWNITILTPNEWAGTNAGNGKTVSCTKCTHDWDANNALKYFKDPNMKELIVGEWRKENDGTVIYIDENLNYHFKYNGYDEIVEGNGTIDKYWRIENTSIYSVAGNILLIGRYNLMNPTRFDGIYTFLNK